uniref:2-C-methyl-D-erythritol 2,4-cyclodiphosphate synthase n=1 Tax=Paulinella longichromatophora TaxID=1708747 RepID=A0A2H4ZP13_9EUKA|nr:2C-methyl-D-erythritol 2,4-cyclodiphosphate synthase [Paulinella longichromatophora]
MELRIGNGYDIHRLIPGRLLILGGQQIEHPEGLGLDGHSDADVLVHAIIDALLGALGLGDIGKYFPPDDPQWKGANSLILLNTVVEIISEQGWSISNIDSVLILERPKLKNHIQKMQATIASHLNISISQVGLKATTNEKIGSIGREEGIACYAVALLNRLDRVPRT